MSRRLTQISPLIMSLISASVIAGIENKETIQSTTSDYVLGECSINAMPAQSNVRYTSAERNETHCVVSGVIEKEINFQVRLPHDWNGMFAQSGGGGFVGSVVDYIDEVALGPGYATAGTDTGHRAHALESSWAAQNPYREERLENFGGRAVHLTTQTAKVVIERYYEQESERNLFFGCSRGGGQGLIAAQRYPTDYDVIVAGSPAYDWSVRLGGHHSAIAQKMFPNSGQLDKAIIGTKEIELVNSLVAEQCKNADGLDNSGLIEPWKCEVDFQALQCDEEGGECLSSDQIEVFELVYNGFYDSKGNPLAEGFYFGANADMIHKWLAGGLKVNDMDEFQSGVRIDPDLKAPVTPNFGYAFGHGIMKNFIFDGEYNSASYDFDNLRQDGNHLGKYLDAINPDLRAFRDNGGKLIMWNGLQDVAISPASTVSYYKDVIKHDPTAANDVALFLLPGVDHCAGGVGPWLVDWMGEGNQWADTNVAPREVVAHWVDPEKGIDGNRKVCAYPEVAMWDGKGDPRSANSFRCESPN